MKTNAMLLSALLFAAAPSIAEANNACRSSAIISRASVTTSDGAAYEVDAYYRSPKETAVAFATDAVARMAVEGGLAWSAREDAATRAGENEKRFVIGHQFHALALKFDEIAADVSEVTGVAFDGETFNGRRGGFPFGGTATLLETESGRPRALFLNLPEESEITVAYNDWRSRPGGEDLPFSLTVTHDDNEYYYRYTDISILDGEGGKDSIDFHDAFPAPDIDEVKIHRLHRAILAAHCRGDAEKIAALTAPEAIIANRGELMATTPEETGAQFRALFSRVDYTGYHDLEDPIVSVARSGEMGWAAVNPRAEGRVVESGETFSSQWAWVMLARKIDGAWRHAGNASNRKPE